MLTYQHQCPNLHYLYPHLNNCRTLADIPQKTLLVISKRTKEGVSLQTCRGNSTHACARFCQTACQAFQGIMALLPLWELPSLLLVPWAQNFSAGLPEPSGCYGCPETYSGPWMVGRNFNFTLAYLGPEAVLLVPKVLHIFQELSVSGPSPSSLFPN